MKRRPAPRDPFALVSAVGLALPDVEVGTRYDGSSVLRLGGCFMAGLATHPSAEPHTLIVRCSFEDRTLLIEEAPSTYYLTEPYVKHPVVLARLSQLDRDALHGLLLASWQMTLGKTRKKPSVRSRVRRA